jgi:hypothetical protein
MRRKLFMLAFVLVATAASTFTAPHQAEAACNPSCCGANDCSCCGGLCHCPNPELAARH